MTLEEAIFGFEACWPSQFWMPDSIQGDRAFLCGSFKTYMDERSIQFWFVSSGRHRKNPLDSKHGLMRSIFLKLREDEPDAPPELYAMRAVAISNELYGNYVMSSFELPKGFKKPVISGDVKETPK